MLAALTSVSSLGTPEPIGFISSYARWADSDSNREGWNDGYWIPWENEPKSLPLPLTLVGDPVRLGDNRPEGGLAILGIEIGLPLALPLGTARGENGGTGEDVVDTTAEVGAEDASVEWR